MEIKFIDINNLDGVKEILTELIADAKKRLENLENEQKKTPKEEPKEPVVFSYNSCIKQIAKRANISIKKVDKTLRTLFDIYPTCVFQILLKELAIVMDQKYKDHISHSKEIWVVNTLNGKVCLIDKEKIVNYRNFAAFRSKEEAETACDALKGFLNELFSK